MNDSGPPGSLWDEAQPVDIIVAHIDKQTINLAASVSHHDDQLHNLF